MAIFQPIELRWGGHDYTIPADRILGAICVIEDVVTMPELITMLRGKPNFSRLARAYGDLLRYAGAFVSDEEVYEGLFKPGEQRKRIALTINLLIAMMTPPSAIVAAGAPSRGNSKAAPSSSSKRSTRRRSAAAG
jgi:hypothetical protein